MSSWPLTAASSWSSCPTAAACASNDLRVVYKQFVVHPQVATAGALAFCAASKQQKGHEMDVSLWDKMTCPCGTR